MNLERVRTVGLTVLGVVMVATGLACSAGDPDPNPPPETPVRVHVAGSTDAVCSATRNAYLQDAIGSDITGKAIFDLSNKDGVDTSVRTAVHNLFTGSGKTVSAKPGDIESAYERVMSKCTAYGWEPK
jgi:hypothetical protein